MTPNDFSDIVTNPPAPTTWRDYLTTKYFFETPPAASKLYLVWIILFSLLILLAIATKFGDKEIKKVTERYFYPFLICGILGFVYLFGRYEGLPFLATRFFLTVILAVLFIAIIWNAIWFIGYIKKYSTEKITEEKYSKYLPKSKSKI